MASILVQHLVGVFGLWGELPLSPSVKYSIKEGKKEQVYSKQRKLHSPMRCLNSNSFPIIHKQLCQPGRRPSHESILDRTMNHNVVTSCLFRPMHPCRRLWRTKWSSPSQRRHHRKYLYALNPRKVVSGEDVLGCPKSATAVLSSVVYFWKKPRRVLFLVGCETRFANHF